MKEKMIKVIEISWKEAQDIMFDHIEPYNLNVESLLYDAISRLFEAHAKDIDYLYHVVNDDGSQCFSSDDLPFDSIRPWTERNDGNYPDFREQYFDKAYQTIKDYLNHAFPNH